MAAKLYGEAVARIVSDPETAAALTPTHPFGCKRPIIDQGYYETFNRDNVTLVDLRKGPIRAVTPTGIETEQGSHELDVIIYATGFDAMTGALSRIDIRGRDGVSLKDFWASEGPLSYLGLAVAGFPNLFIVQAPGSPAAATQFRRRAGTARRVDRRLHHAPARQRLPHHRGAARCAAGLDRAHHIACRADGARPPDLQLLVQRRQRPRKEADVHGLHRRDTGVPEAMRRDRRGRLHRVQARVADEDLRAGLPGGSGFCGGAAARACRVEKLRRLETFVADGCTSTRRGDARRTRAVGDDADRAAAEAGAHRLPSCQAAADELSALGVERAHASPEPLAVKSIRRRRLGRLTYEKLKFDHEPTLPDSLAAVGLGGPATAVAHLCRTGDDARPWLVWVHGAGQGQPIDLLFSRARRIRDELGFNIALPVQPGHGSRRDAWPPYPNMDPLTNVAGMMRVVSEVRALVRWLRPQSTRDGGVRGLDGKPGGSACFALRAGRRRRRVHTDPRAQRDDLPASGPMGPFGGRDDRAVGFRHGGRGDLRRRPHGRRTDRAAARPPHRRRMARPHGDA